MDYKSIGLCPQGLESPRCRSHCLHTFGQTCHTGGCTVQGSQQGLSCRPSPVRGRAACARRDPAGSSFSGRGEGLEIYWALPTGARTPRSVSNTARERAPGLGTPAAAQCKGRSGGYTRRAADARQEQSDSSRALVSAVALASVGAASPGRCKQVRRGACLGRAVHRAI